MAELEINNHAADLVNSLYKFRDLYFVHNSIDQADHKISDVEREMKITLAKLDKLEDKNDKADMCLFRGKALNVLPAHNSMAEEYLSKAVKLNPKLSEAWLHLGECYVKKGDVEAAKNCFLNVLTANKDKAALRNLSMVIRQLSKSSKDSISLIEESVEKAKEAVQLDIRDGYSWYVLGNAYLSLFFAKGQTPAYLKQSYSAYKQAEKDQVMANYADLHFNWSSIYTFQLDFDQTVFHLDKATKLDPTWTEAQRLKTQILSYLDNISNLTATNGRLKEKKLHQMLSTLSESEVGPFNSQPRKSLAELTESTNKSCVILGRVVCSLPPNDPIPFTFCLRDHSEVCVPVVVYNLASNTGPKVGDSVAILEPQVKDLSVHFEEHNYQLRFIRCESPIHIVINGKRLSQRQLVPSALAVNLTGD